MSEKEHCPSHIASSKSREVHLQTLFCLTQTRKLNFNLPPLGLESYARHPPTPAGSPLDSENPSPYLRTGRSSAAWCCHQLYSSHSKAFNPTRSFFLKVTTLPKEATRPVPTKMSTQAGLHSYFHTLLYCLSAWLLLSFTVDQHY